MVDPVASQRALLIALVEAQLRFVVIGGHAVAAHGYERATRDVGVVFSTDRDNCERFAELLRRLDASVRAADLPAPEGRITAIGCRPAGTSSLRPRTASLTRSAGSPGLDYAVLDSRALTAELADGTQLRICSYDDLVALKRAADRPRDREDLRELAALRDVDG